MYVSLIINTIVSRFSVNFNSIRLIGFVDIVKQGTSMSLRRSFVIADFLDSLLFIYYGCWWMCLKSTRQNLIQFKVIKHI